MAFEAVKSALIVFGLTSTVAAWAEDGAVLNAYREQPASAAAVTVNYAGRADQSGRIANVPEPSGWASMAIGLLLIGAVAHRRKARS